MQRGAARQHRQHEQLRALASEVGRLQAENRRRAEALGAGEKRSGERSEWPERLPAFAHRVDHHQFSLGIIGLFIALVRPGGGGGRRPGHRPGPLVCEPPHPAWEALVSAFLLIWRANGLNPLIEHRLPTLLRAAGLIDVEVEVHGPADAPGCLPPQASASTERLSGNFLRLEAASFR